VLVALLLGVLRVRARHVLQVAPHEAGRWASSSAPSASSQFVDFLVDSFGKLIGEQGYAEMGYRIPEVGVGVAYWFLIGKFPL
jgi:hypothetical protein